MKGKEYVTDSSGDVRSSLVALRRHDSKWDLFKRTHETSYDLDISWTLYYDATEHVGLTKAEVEAVFDEYDGVMPKAKPEIVARESSRSVDTPVKCWKPYVM